MGANYRGTPAEFIDNAMFQLPYELIGNIVDKKNKEAEEYYTNALKLGDVTINGIQGVDSKRAKELVQGIQEEAQGLANDIKGNYMNWDSSKLAQLQKKTTDILKNEGAALEGHYKGLQKYIEDETKRVGKENMTPELQKNLTDLFIRDWNAKGGTSWKSPNQYNTPQFEYMKGLDKTETEFLSDFFKNMTGKNYKYSWDNEKGDWRYTGTNGTEGFLSEDIDKYTKDFYIANPDRLAAIDQRGRAGIFGFDTMKDLVDGNGNLKNLKDIVNEQGEIIGQSQNLIGRNVKAMQDVYRKRITETSRGSSMTDLGNHKAKSEYDEAMNPEPGINVSSEDSNLPYENSTSFMTSYNNQNATINTFGQTIGKALSMPSSDISGYVLRGEYDKIRKLAASKNITIPDLQGQIENAAAAVEKRKILLEKLREFNKGKNLSSNNFEKEKQLIASASTPEFKKFLEEKKKSTSTNTYTGQSSTFGIKAGTTKKIGALMAVHQDRLPIVFMDNKSGYTELKSKDGTLLRFLAGNKLPKGNVGPVKIDKKTNLKYIEQTLNGKNIKWILGDPKKEASETSIGHLKALGVDVGVEAPTIGADSEGSGLGDAFTKAVAENLTGKKAEYSLNTKSPQLTASRRNGKPMFLTSFNAGEKSFTVGVPADHIDLPEVNSVVNGKEFRDAERYQQWDEMQSGLENRAEKMVAEMSPAGRPMYVSKKDGKYMAYEKTKNGDLITSIPVTDTGTAQQIFKRLYYNTTKPNN